MLASRIAQLHAGFAELQVRVDELVDAVGRPGWSAARVTEGLRELASSARVLRGGLDEAKARVDADAARIDEVLDVLFGMAGLDFSRRAYVSDEGGRLDALAASCNMLSEELEASRREIEGQNQELREATRAKSQFLANMSHEIRTPLGAMLGFADLLLDPEMNESERLNCVLVIRRNGEHLLAVINDILDLSKIEAGKLSIERVEMSVAQLLNEIESLMRVRAVAKGLAFRVSLDGPVPARIVSDPTRVRQVLLNLVGNAVKFTEAGKVEVVVGFEPGAPGRIAFDVIDTGIGMTAEASAGLFKPFQQADPSMSRRFGGTGLGLAICKPLADALDGTIRVTSALGKGSRFRFEMAAEVPAGTPMLTSWRDLSPSSARVELGPGRRLTGSVLLAEDGIDNQVLITSVLRRAGLRVVVAENGAIAVARVLAARESETPFDLVLMDMQMPELDGYGAAATLRERGYKGPILALTAHAMAGERERCLKAGCDDYMSKPFDRREFVRMVERHLTGARGSTPDAAAPPELDEASREAPELSAIAGLDAAAGLARTGGDRDLYRDLLRRFARHQPESVARLRGCASAGAWAEADRIVHTLRGVAGNIGATAIFERATRLGAAIASEDGPVFARELASLEVALEPLVAAIVAALSSAPLAEPAAGELEQLHALIHDSDPEATELFTRLRERLEASYGHAPIAELGDALDRYDFEEAGRWFARHAPAPG